MQSSLFDDPANTDEVFTHDLGNAQIDEYPTAFSAAHSETLYRQLHEQIPWHEDSLLIAGRKVLVPRLQCWMGDKGSRYGYSGIRLEPKLWSEPVLDIKSRIEGLTGMQFNSVLLNLYRSGMDSVSWHSDDEKELGRFPVIASVSLGCERTFQLRPKESPNASNKVQIVLRNGSLLLMGKHLQNNWMHQIPKVKNLNEARINLTFRQIIGNK